jgi:hypothetical protein
VVTWKKLASEEQGVKVSDSDRLVFFGPAGESIPDIRHISHSIFKIIIRLLLSVLFAGTSAAQSTTPVAVVEDFLKPWNSHPRDAFDRLFTAAHAWVLACGDRQRSMQFFGEASQSDIDEQNQIKSSVCSN